MQALGTRIFLLSLKNKANYITRVLIAEPIGPILAYVSIICHLRRRNTYDDDHDDVDDDHIYPVRQYFHGIRRY